MSDNRIKIEQLANLTNLVELFIQFNQIDSLHIQGGMFPHLEKLHLSYNNIPANHLPALSHLPALTHLDLASNDLITLPESLAFLSSVEELNLASNQFSSDSTLVKPSKLFLSIGSMPSLKRLNLSRNKFTAFHYDYLSESSFSVLQELDFSYNLVEDQGDLMYCQNIHHLLTLIITGNPFAQHGKESYSELEHILSTTLSAVIINRTEFSSRIAKRLRLRPENEGLKSLPYPKPMSLMSGKYEEEGKDDKRGKQKMLDAEMNKGIALPISDMRLTTKQEEEIFPDKIDGKDVFTPPMGEMGQDEGNRFFITEDEGSNYQQERQKKVRKEEEKGAIRELNSEESGDDDDKEMDIQNAEREVQDKNIFDDVQDNVDFGKMKMDEFKRNAVEILLNDNDAEYESPLDLPYAYKSLKELIKNPVIVHSKRPHKGYMKQTFATSRHAIAVKGDEERFLEYSKLSKQSKIEQSKMKLGYDNEELKLPPILAIKNGESEYIEPTLLEKLEGFAGKPKQNLSRKQEKINKKVEALLEADRKRMRDESMMDGEMIGKQKDPKKVLREKHGFSDSDDY